MRSHRLRFPLAQASQRGSARASQPSTGAITTRVPAGSSPPSPSQESISSPTISCPGVNGSEMSDPK